MDALKLIPQVFFDAIARVVPGAFCLVCLQAATRAPILQWIFEGVVPPGPLQTSSALWMLVVSVSSYVVGHLMSPAVKYLEWSPRPKSDSSVDQHGDSRAKGHEAVTRKKRLPRFVLRAASIVQSALQPLRELILPFRRPGRSHPDCVWRQYDWLRLEKPEVGGLVARIRAEYTMYGGFAVSLILTLAVVVSRASLDWLIVYGHTSQALDITRLEAALKVSATAVGIVLMLRRHYQTYDTFGKSVANFYSAAEGSERWRRDFVCPKQAVAPAARSTTAVGSAEVSPLGRVER